jgi:TetR/AcrR family transcriptional regulator, mexJK operon transcriptional repressor
MPRLAGQIDLSKNEAILDAAVEVMVERGVGASMEEIARRACVSKQTIYNHYGSKAELVRALTERRVDEVTATLQGPAAAAHPAEALAGYARSLLQSLLRTKSTPFMRMAIASVAETPELARAMYEAGPRASRRRLADFLAMETAAGRLACPDAAQAAEFFGGMVLGSFQTASLLGVEAGLDDARIEAVASEAAARFLKAYAP